MLPKQVVVTEMRRINLRGFSSQNVAVMINGVPVNDMENGAVYIGLTGPVCLMLHLQCKYKEV